MLTPLEAPSATHSCLLHFFYMQPAPFDKYLWNKLFYILLISYFILLKRLQDLKPEITTGRSARCFYFKQALKVLWNTLILWNCEIWHTHLWMSCCFSLIQSLKTIKYCLTQLWELSCNIITFLYLYVDLFFRKRTGKQKGYCVRTIGMHA